ncbi:hypothetical protein H1C71_002453 [Ictidomys tridecemlineatus]|nr:hypothetical protein H1C71_002453 [Ictidomys tridecemlineatus]
MVEGRYSSLPNLHLSRGKEEKKVIGQSCSEINLVLSPLTSEDRTIVLCLFYKSVEFCVVVCLLLLFWFGFWFFGVVGVGERLGIEPRGTQPLSHIPSLFKIFYLETGSH